MHTKSILWLNNDRWWHSDQPNSKSRSIFWKQFQKYNEETKICLLFLTFMHIIKKMPVYVKVNKRAEKSYNSVLRINI